MPQKFKQYNPCYGLTPFVCWAECFHLHGVRIDPANAVGEGTAKLLQINEDNRVRERQVLAEVGRYPTIEALARMKE